MRHVILISGAREMPAGGLCGALRDAGVTFTLVCASNFIEDEPHTKFIGGATITASPSTKTPPSALAVVFDVTPCAEVGVLHTEAARAADAWPGIPLVACHRAAPVDEGQPHAPQLDAAMLRRLGFHAVADEPAQLASVLRKLETEGASSGGSPASNVNATQHTPAANLSLPKRLGTERLRAAFEIVASLHFATEQRGAADAALAGLAGLVRADRWTIYLITEGEDEDEVLFEPLAARGLTKSERALPAQDWRRALTGNAMRLAGAQSLAAREAVASAEPSRRHEGARRIVAIPLTGGERVIGVLEAVREGASARAFSDADTSLLSVLSLPLTAALTNVVRIAEAERLSQTDDLTKLHNARFLRQYLVGELKRARRYGSSVSAVFLDLDDFKLINDRHGHLVGSHVLFEMARVILSCLRDTDVVSRYGGDEFVTILPETGLEHGALVAERIRARIAAHIFTGGRNLRLRLTASFGIAVFPQHAHSPQQLIACADAAMYEAKAARKNCVRFAAETTD